MWGDSFSPISQALVLTGDMWTIKIVRAVFLGRRRFQDLREGLHISDPVLARRLKTLVQGGLLGTQTYSSRPIRRDYLLTPAGLDLWKVMLAMWAWDRTWAGHQHHSARLQMHHLGCGQIAQPVFGCGACGAIGVSARDVTVAVDERVLLDAGQRRSRRSPTMASPIDSADVLGDRWSTFLLSAALMGTQRFNDFQEQLAISPVTLTRRLNLFVDTGLLLHDVVHHTAKRRDYRLAPKGLEFFSVFSTINAWAQQWLASDGDTGLEFTHRPCGQRFQPTYTCNSCNSALTQTTIDFERRSGHGRLDPG